ncbi:MAG: type II secretion system protein GspC [Thermodesulfobacteriota bacterium]
MILSILKKYVWVINLVLIISIAYVLALIVNDKLSKTIYSPAVNAVSENAYNSDKFVRLKTKQPNRAYYDAILQRNVFGLVPGSLQTNNSTLGGKVPKTDLNVELLGTYINVSGDSIAVIKNTESGKVNGYTDGEVVDIITREKVKLLGVDNCKALIDRKIQGTETIVCKKDINLNSSTNRTKTAQTKKPVSTASTSDGKDGIKQLSEDKWLIERKMLDELLEDPAALINQARVVPQQDGLRFFGIRPSSVFFKIGLRNGDIVHKINEVELNDVQNALNLFGQLKDESEFSIDFTRRGNKHSYAYSVN